MLRGWVDPRGIVRLGGLCQWKIPMIPSGINPATFRFAVQCLNHYVTAWPYIIIKLLYYYKCDKFCFGTSVIMRTERRDYFEKYSVEHNWKLIFVINKGGLFLCCCDVTMKLTSLKFVYSFRGIIWHDFLWGCTLSGVRQFVDKFVVLPDVGSKIDCWCHLTNQFFLRFMD
jgi:hypothetical protein